MTPDAILHEAEGQDPQRPLSMRLLHALKSLCLDQDRIGENPGMHRLGERLCKYRGFVRERATRMCAPFPLIGIIVQGTKEIWLGDHCQRFAPGEVFVMPAHLDLELANIPDKRGGRYESLVIEVSRVPQELAGMSHPRPSHPSDASSPNFRVSLTEELIATLVHAARSLRATEHAAKIADIRLMEVLVLISEQPAARPLFQASLEERLAWLVLAEPLRHWTSEEVGRALGLGASTLRRRLAGCGTSLREILVSVRMGIAYRILTAGEGNVSDAVTAAGYASRSHFIRRFQSVYGAPPSAFRSHK